MYKLLKIIGVCILILLASSNSMFKEAENMAITDYNDPLLITWYTDDDGNKVSLLRSNQTYTVINNRIILSEIPDSFYKVNTINFGSTPVYESRVGTTISDNNFVVNYGLGEITVDSSYNGQTVTIPTWYARGVIKYPASRIHVEDENSNFTGDDLETVLSEINDDIETNLTDITNHKASTSAHASQNITYNGSATGETNVKDAIDATWERISEIITTPAESVTAQEIIDARKGETTLRNKIDGIDSQLAENAIQLSKIDPLLHQNGLKPIFIEQFMTTWQGRGQLTSELPYENTTQRTTFAYSYPAGTYDVILTNAVNIQVGQIVAVEHADLSHGTYFVYSKIGNQLRLFPALRSSVDTNSHLERAWANSAHQGEYAGKFIAEQLANATCEEYSTGELLYEMTFDDANKEMFIMANAIVGSNTASNKPYDNYASPQTVYYGSGFYVVTVGNYSGVRSADFKVKPNSRISIRGYFYTTTSSGILAVCKKDGTQIVYKELGSNACLTREVFNVDIPKDVDMVHLEIRQAGDTPVTVEMDEIRVYEVGNESGYIIPRDGKVVLLFDSWAAYSDSAIPTQLAALLPDCTIIDKGVGGDGMGQMLARFDTDVAPYNPNVVICNSGVNDVANYMSTDAAFELYFAYRQAIIDKCNEIGALPVFLGVPALCESDIYGHSLFELNTKARKVSIESERRLYKKSALNRNTNQYDIAFTIDSLPIGDVKCMILGIVPDNAVVIIKAAGGFGITENTKINVGFAAGTRVLPIGVENGSNLSITSYYSKGDSVLVKDINFSIKNNEGVTRYLVVAVENATEDVFSGSVFVSLEY